MASTAKSDPNLLYTDKRFVNEVLDFINSKISLGQASTSFKGKHIDVSMRQGPRTLGYERMHVIEVVRVVVKRPGRGTYRAFLNLVENNRQEKPVFIENVLDEAQGQSYLKRGYLQLAVEGMPCFALTTNKYNRTLEDYICSYEPLATAPKPTTREVTINMPPDTFNAISKAAKAKGFRSVAEFMLDAAGGNVVDSERVAVLVDIASAHAGLKKQIGETSSFTFKSLLPKPQRDVDNAPTVRDAEKLFRTSMFSFGLELIAKYPNRYSFKQTSKTTARGKK